MMGPLSPPASATYQDPRLSVLSHMVHLLRDVVPGSEKTPEEPGSLEQWGASNIYLYCPYMYSAVSICHQRQVSSREFPQFYKLQTLQNLNLPKDYHL